MRLEITAVTAEVDGDRVRVATAGGVVTLGPLEVEVTPSPDGRSVAWSLANRGDADVSVRSVAVVSPVEDVRGALRMFRHGYQSWSHSGVATFGIDEDPSRTPGSLEMMQGVHHADQRRAVPGELRSEWVTVLADASGSTMLGGFDAGASHDGTWRLRPAPTGGAPELWAEAFLGGAVLGPGTRRVLTPWTVVSGDDPSTMLDAWAAGVGRAGGGRTTAPYQVGWCSWYHYFHGVSEADLRKNLALADQWPFDVFQLDDGYQTAIGDWLTTNDRFPSTIDELADAIAAAGRRPGIWLAPFIVAPDSQVATEHPEWLATFDDGQPLWGMLNPEWGGGRDGVMYALDPTIPEVIDHIASVSGALVEAGFTYLKLDFTFAPSFDGVWADPTRTPAERVRAGYDAVRRGAGDDAFLLGCGAPLSHVVGVVDGNRIGPDVAPTWELAADAFFHVPGYADVAPATRHAWADTLARSFMHRRLWLNDPDCLMLRTAETAMTPQAVRTWAHAVAVSGGMALVSDDLALLDGEARALLDEVCAIGRLADAEAVTGPAPRCEDLLDAATPTTLAAAGFRLVADPVTAESSLTGPS